jgi:hypothetical protein
MPSPATPSKRIGLCVLLIVGLVLLALPAFARQAQAPGAADDSAAAGDLAAAAPAPDASGIEHPAISNGRALKNDRIFGVMPNYTTVQAASDARPLTAGDKFKMTALGAFDPYEFVIVGVLAGINQADNEDAAYGQGAAGFAKRYGAGFADQAIGNFMTGAVFPTILRQDPRYFQLGKGRFGRRFAYALSRLLIARTNAGHRQFNFSEFLGNATAAGISNLYEVPQDRTLANAAVTLCEQISVDGLGNELKEFWPDIRRKILRKKPVNPQA